MYVCARVGAHALAFIFIDETGKQACIGREHGEQRLQRVSSTRDATKVVQIFIDCMMCSESTGRVVKVLKQCVSRP